jgi:hypothetical protein|tara:strand:- start:556 stop:702 length:147 start_codon:yes stop_codon:yes gene_type:complete
MSRVTKSTEIIQMLEKTINRGGDEKTIITLKRKLKELKKNHTDGNSTE